jgi:multidrug efflux pump subunit AcrB
LKIAGPVVKLRTVTWFASSILLIAGGLSYFQLGRLEDPEFTVKTAVVTTFYAGASAEEVELEVTDRLEIAIQTMPQVRQVESLSRPGVSMINVEIRPEFRSAELPQIWDELRKKVSDTANRLPPGTDPPVVGDDFGDVYGFLLAVTRDNGYTDAELERYVDDLKRELSLVSGVARVELWGVRQQCIYIDVATSQLTQLGITLEQLHRALATQNLVVDSGGVSLPTDRLRIRQTGTFQSPEEIGELAIRGLSPAAIALLGASENSPSEPAGSADEIIRIRDIGQVRRGYLEPPQALMRFNGDSAIGLAIANVPSVNIVQLGENLDSRLAELISQLPVGIEVDRISWQSDLVAQSIDQFMVSLLQAVTIVLVVLWLATGLRTAVVVGLCGLVFVILASFLVMQLWGIDLQRMSLGALVIAMGMMVDNAIVVVDGILVRIQKGMDRTEAAIEAATTPSIPLLGATVIGVMAFYPIYASEESAGEYCESLFQVVAVALLLSWILSVTVTPLMAILLLPGRKARTGNEGDSNESSFLRMFRKLLALAIRFRWLVVGAMTILLLAALWGFQIVDRTFFPDSARLQIMVDYWAPQGTRVETVSRDVQPIEKWLLADDSVSSVSTFVGQGPPRFYLPVEPERPHASYAQMIVNVNDLDSLNRLIPRLDAWAGENVPEATVIVRRYGLGPSETWTVEGRISGPGNASPNELRQAADQVVSVFAASPHCKVVRTNWRERELQAVIEYNQERARWSGISRGNIARATRQSDSGDRVGLYREQDKLLPIFLRTPLEERVQFASSLPFLQIHPTLSATAIPLSQVIDQVQLQWVDVNIWRRDRRRTVSVQARTADGVPASLLFDDVRARAETQQLPPGYKFEWGGERESSQDAQKSLLPGLIPAGIIMAIAVVALFNALRPPLIIVCVIPFAMIGVTIGLVVTGQPFGFLALLGAMSLVGMMIKNAIVLLDEVNLEKRQGKSDYHAVVDAAASRLRPVLLAAATTVLGVMPLLSDVFWVAMAVTIMFGLAFGTVLTMILIPVLYACFYRIE